MLLALLTGCGAEPAARPTASPPATKAAPVASAEPQIRVQQIDKAGLSAVIGHLPGKVVLVDCWATWCPKCRDYFPHTVELSRKFGPADLVVISLACDDAGQMDQVLEFLRMQNATFQNLRSAFGSDEKTFEDFEITGGALPHYKLFDQKGKLYRTFASDPEAAKQFTLEEIDAAIEELLAAKPTENAVLPSPDQPTPPEEKDAEG
jgi:thiol-disulfide isomerase/thioredoxin